MVNNKSKQTHTVLLNLKTLFRAQDMPDETQLMRTTQGVRVGESYLPFMFILLAATAVCANFSHEIAITSMIGWLTCLTAAIVFELVINSMVSSSLASADFVILKRNRRALYAANTATSLAAGSCFWWLTQAQPNNDNLANTLLLFCVIYALTALYRLSIQFSAFILSAALALGQPAAFYLGTTGTMEPIISAGLLAYTILLSLFSLENTRQFSTGVIMQGENLSLLDQLNVEKNSVDHALEKAESANDTKNHFLAAASHDLRQPLYALSLYLGSLEQLIGKGKARDIIDKMTDTTAFLNDQFNSLLDLAQFDAGAISVRVVTFELRPLLDRLGASFASQAAEKGVSFEVQSESISVTTDPQLLERVLRNILENAIRYTQQGHIVLSARLAGELCQIAIQDSGKGIDPEDQTKIFDDFVQVGNSARNKEHGVGLGLAIVSRICKLLAHPLTLESQPGTGSTFTLSLPGQRQSQTSQHDIETTQNELIKGMRIWVLDDNTEILDALNMQLEAWGCETTLMSSEDELEAAYSAQGCWPHLIMLDDMLAENHSGLEIAKALSQKIDTNTLALITGNTQGDRLKEIGQSGFRCLLKPVANWELKNLLSTVMEDTHVYDYS